MSIRLTPAGHLRWEPGAGEAAPADSASLESLQSAFQADWREALFTLAADKMPVQGMPSVRYWQQLAEHYLTGLCHIPDGAERFHLEAPSPADCARWVLTAPPMAGGEYLGTDTLRLIWERMDRWVRESVAGAGGIAAFLRAVERRSGTRWGGSASTWPRTAMTPSVPLRSWRPMRPVSARRDA